MKLSDGSIPATEPGHPAAGRVGEGSAANRRFAARPLQIVLCRIWNPESR